MKSALTKELLLWTAVALLCLWAQVPVFGQQAWFQYNPPGSVNGQGIHRDVLSRISEAGRQKMYDPDPITWTHESTHELNSVVRNQVGGNVNAFYVGNGGCAVLSEPRVTLAMVANYVSPQYRDGTFNLYLVQQQSGWNQQPLYILDEYSAYINGAQHGMEIGRPRQSDFDHCRQFAYFSDCLVACVRDNDPGYAQLDQLTEFIEYQKGRVSKLQGGSMVAQSCVNGFCYPQQGQRVIVRPVQKQSPPKPASYTDPQWVAWRDKIQDQLDAIKQCNCDHSQQVTIEQVNQAITEVDLRLQGLVQQKIDANEYALMQRIKAIESPTPYVPPTPQQQAEAILPYLPPVVVSLEQLDGTKDTQRAPLGQSIQMKLVKRSVDISNE